MKHSLVLKFVAILLTALALVSALGGGVGIIAMENANLYVDDVSKLQDLEYESIAKTIAQDSAQIYAVETYANLPYLLERSLYSRPEERSDTDFWAVILQKDGQTVSTLGSVSGNVAFSKTFTIQSVTFFSLFMPFPQSITNGILSIYGLFWLKNIRNFCR